MAKKPNRRDLTERNLDAAKKRDKAQNGDIADIVRRIEAIEHTIKILSDPPWARRRDQMPQKVYGAESE